MALSGVKYDSLKEEKEQELRSVSTSDDNDDDSMDSDYGEPASRESRQKWWFQHPAIKRNKWAVILAHILLFVGIGCVIAGVALEITYHTGMDDIIRGFVFLICGLIVLIPSVYAWLHMYLAAKRVGRIRFSSVWFFTR